MTGDEAAQTKRELDAARRDLAVTTALLLKLLADYRAAHQTPLTPPTRRIDLDD